MTSPLLIGILLAGAPNGALEMLRIGKDPLLVRTLYASPSRIASDIDASGAVSVNQKGGGKFFIEQQRYGGDLIQAGLASGDEKLIDLGAKVLDWGFDRQSPRGDFPGTGDAFHSTSLFVEAAARAVLLMQAANRVDGRVERWRDGVRRAAAWMSDSTILRPGMRKNLPFTHRYWLVAAALAEANLATHTSNAMASKIADEGVRAQLPNGVNLERGGPDASYQAFGLLCAERFYLASTDSTVRSRTLTALDRGLSWLDGQIGRDGRIAVSDDTRTGREVGRSGRVKSFDFRSLVQCLVFGSRILHRPELMQTAEAVARGRGWSLNPDHSTTIGLPLAGPLTR